MNNNDILIRLRYALDIKDVEMIEIFKLGGVSITKDDLQRMLLNQKNSRKSDSKDDGFIADENMKKCNNYMLDSFLNGFIILKRGKQESNSNVTENKVQSFNEKSIMNNVMLKKVKIALSLTSEEVIEILNIAGINISKGELSAVLRREGQRNYRECGDRYARNFLKGLAMRYRKSN
ncbi:MAG TPA: DUF1456 family protein [Mobilitalea sp.]|nr:DUF1456 family protein [Mobilitalea sp.]